jgi:hypothetical protein
MQDKEDVPTQSQRDKELGLVVSFLQEVLATFMTHSQLLKGLKCEFK